MAHPAEELNGQTVRIWSYILDIKANSDMPSLSDTQFSVDFDHIAREFEGCELTTRANRMATRCFTDAV